MSLSLFFRRQCELARSYMVRIFFDTHFISAVAIVRLQYVHAVIILSLPCREQLSETFNAGGSVG